jgi:hypothetical protein
MLFIITALVALVTATSYPEPQRDGSLRPPVATEICQMSCFPEKPTCGRGSVSHRRRTIHSRKCLRCWQYTSTVSEKYGLRGRRARRTRKLLPCYDLKQNTDWCHRGAGPAVVGLEGPMDERTRETRGLSNSLEVRPSLQEELFRIIVTRDFGL